MGCLFLSRLLWTKMECAYCVAIMLICLNVLLICGVGSLSCVSNAFIEGMWVVALAPEAKTMSGATIHPLVVRLLMSGWYFVVFLSTVSVKNLSLQYVNSMYCIVIYGVGATGGGELYGCPMTHKISGLSRALQWQRGVSHVHGSNHAGTVFSWGESLYMPAFISV